jgi:hypothetical protein
MMGLSGPSGGIPAGRWSENETVFLLNLDLLKPIIWQDRLGTSVNTVNSKRGSGFRRRLMVYLRLTIGMSSGKNTTHSFAPFYPERDHFTKTGSGQI